jgi:hypothetical protein
MSCKTPQLSAVTENDLVESSLQRSFKNVVSGCSNVDVAVVAAWTLRVDCSNTASVFGKLKKYFQVYKA